MTETTKERSDRSGIMVPAFFRGERQELGLEGKTQVEWRSGKQFVNDPPNEGYYRVGATVIGQPMPDKLDLKEAYPTCLLVTETDEKTTKAHIEGLPRGGIRDIEFTHYCVGPCRYISFSPGPDRNTSIEVGAISFYNEVSEEKTS